MRPAPAFDCASCGRRIGKTSGHNLVSGAVWCSRCLNRHAAYAQATDVGSTRAGIAYKLGLWPNGGQA
jgi:hypothetical protein